MSEIVYIPVPRREVEGVHFLASHLLSQACHARDRAIAVEKENPDNLAADATVAIILSAAAAEGFINEAGELARRLKAGPAVKSFGDIIGKLEEDRASVQAKYVAASLALTGKPFDKGKRPFQEFTRLVKLRDCHMLTDRAAD